MPDPGTISSPDFTPIADLAKNPAKVGAKTDAGRHRVTPTVMTNESRMFASLRRHA
jgi:hypothetical protein